MRILLAIDNSRPSAAAVSAVLARPWPLGSVIRVLSCVPPLVPTGTPDAAIGSALYLNNAHQQLLAEAQQISASVATELALHDFNAHAVVRRGAPALEIVSEAKAWGADLIILGTHGYTGFKKLFYGSVAQAVVGHAPCSVEVVKQTTIKQSAGGSGKRIYARAAEQPADIAA